VIDGTEPTPDNVRDSAIPATYRRAPRTERFILTGIGIGAAVGLILGVILPAGTAIGRGTAGLLLAIGGALAGGLVTGAQAAFIEYTSGRSADRQRHDIESDWEPPVGVDPESLDSESPAASASNDDEGAGDGSR